jgi:hypothetical protein
MAQILTMRVLLTVFIVVLELAAHAQSNVDAMQAEAMVELLERCKAGPVPQEAIEKVIALPGTQLIIGQQNISRRITPAQYEAVLVSACKGKVAPIRTV